MDTQLFRPSLTPAGDRHPITQLAFDPASNQRIWEGLPEQYGTNIAMEAKDGATVLATHPRLRVKGEPMPVIAVSEAGEGRVMALTTDSSWRWGFESVGDGGTPREYQVFWNSAIRWLIQDPELKLLRVDPTEDLVHPGEILHATIRLQKADYTPAPGESVTIKLERRSLEAVDKGSNARETVWEQELETDASGAVVIEHRVTKPGVFEVLAEASTDAGDLRDRDLVLSTPAVQEFRDIIPRDELLERIADATNGVHSTTSLSVDRLNRKEPRTVQVNRRTVIHLWDNAFLFLLVIALLGTEWTLRRRWGRL